MKNVEDATFPDHAKISFPLRSPLVTSLVDCTTDMLERYERIVGVGAGFYPACLQAPE